MEKKWLMYDNESIDRHRSECCFKFLSLKDIAEGMKSNSATTYIQLQSLAFQLMRNPLLWISTCNRFNFNIPL